MDLMIENASTAKSDCSSTDVLSAFVRFNRTLIDQGVELLSRISDDVYATATTGLSAATVGGHFRHCIEFYDALVNGLRSGTIDYDNRPRDARMERDRKFAIERLRSIASRLAEIENADDRPLKVHVTSPDGRTSDVTSSQARELEAAASHTIHHYAIIAILVRAGGVEVDTSFGLALSTQRFLNESAATT
jgi:hypothetical protein